jgi:uncharacterized glyoxalase superfamily protein PhnB
MGQRSSIGSAALSASNAISSYRATCRDPEGHVWSFGSHDPWTDK